MWRIANMLVVAGLLAALSLVNHPVSSAQPGSLDKILAEASLVPVQKGVYPPVPRIASLPLMFDTPAQIWHDGDKQALKKLAGLSQHWEQATLQQQNAFIIRSRPYDFATGLPRKKIEPHQAWYLGLPTATKIADLLALKKKIKPLGYDAYFSTDYAHGGLFNTRAEADKYAASFKHGANVSIVEEPAATAVIDHDVNVLSTEGGVEKLAPDLDQQKRIEDAKNFLGPLLQAAHFLGFKVGPEKGKGDEALRAFTFVGNRFKFGSFEPNWLPPQAKVEYLAGSKVKISVPRRFLVKVTYDGAFVVKDLDQYKYIEANLVTEDGAKAVAKLKEWEKAYGATLLASSGDGILVYFEKMPADFNRFEKEVEAFNPDSAGSSLKDFKKTRVAGFWWEP